MTAELAARATTDVDVLFASYQATHDPALREQLILAHVQLVRYVANRMLPGLHASVELNDLISYGMFGLIGAIERYDPTREAKFSTFATYRIQGAIQDELRSQAWEPKGLRSQFRKAQQALGELEHSLGRAPSETEVAEYLGWDVATLRRVEQGMEQARVSSLDTGGSRPDESGETSLEALLPDVDTIGDLGPQLGEVSVLLAEAMCRLPSSERRVLEMIYVREMTLKAIAAELEVTDSWISHLHTRAMVSLQRVMAAQF